MGGPVMPGSPGSSTRLATAQTYPAISDIVLERLRQVEEKGYSPEHDDAHTTGQMRGWAMSYIRRSAQADIMRDRAGVRRRLVQAAAVLVAAIESLDRQAQAEEEATHE